MAQVDRHDSERSYDKPGADSASISWMAWIASGVGLLLFLGSVGVLGYEGLFRNGGNPVIALSLEEVSHDGKRWHASIRAENTGGATGARVRVAGHLMSGSTIVETAEAEFDYLPAGSTQRGGLFFDRDASAHEVRLRVLGYAAP